MTEWEVRLSAARRGELRGDDVGTPVAPVDYGGRGVAEVAEEADAGKLQHLGLPARNVAAFDEYEEEGHCDSLDDTLVQGVEPDAMHARSGVYSSD